MTQVSDYIIENALGVDVQADLNGVLAAIRTNNSGPTAPLNAVPGLFWLNTSVTPNVLYSRDGTNTAWVEIGTLAQITAEATARAAADAALGVRIDGTPTKTGGGASGTWGINISGNAASAANPTFSGDATQKLDITTRTESGFYENGGLGPNTTSGWPEGGSQWQHLLAVTHSNDNNYYSMQLAGSFYRQQWYMRNTSGVGSTAWAELLTSASYNAYSPTLTGAGASGTWGINISGNAATATSAANAGATAPAAPVAGMSWLDTSVSPAVLKSRDGTNTSWKINDLASVGLGVDIVPLSGSLDDITLSGFYTCNGATTGVPVSGYFWTVQHRAHTGTSGATQHAISTLTDRTFVRHKFQNVWNSWVETPKVSDFPMGLGGSSTGYQKLPSGFIKQWGAASYLATSGATGLLVTLPITFPTGILGASGVDTSSTANSVGASAVSTSSIRLWGKSAGTYANTTIFYEAIGY